MSIEQAKWLVEFYQQVADGGEMQVLYKAHWSLAASGPDLDSLQEHWRVVMPPKVTPVEKLQAEIERLKAQAEYHFESQREDYNRLEDTLVANDDLKAEIEQLNAELDYSADYANKQQAEIESLNSRLKVLQNYHKEGPEGFDMAALYAALWDEEQVKL